MSQSQQVVESSNTVQKSACELSGVSTKNESKDSKIYIDSASAVVSTDERLKMLFQKSVSCTLQKYMSSIKFSLFEGRYQEIHQNHPKDLTDIYSQFLTQLKPKIQDDLDQLIEGTNINPLLCDLENIIKMNANNTDGPSWRPSGNPEEDVRDHIFLQKKKHKKALEYYLNIMSAEKESLEEEVFKNDEEIRNIQETIKDLHQKVKEALGTFDVSKLRQIQDTMHELKKTDVSEKQ